jgi:hypothetical protein
MRVLPPPEEGAWRVGFLCAKAPGSENGAFSKLHDSLEGWNLNWLKDRLPSGNNSVAIYGPEMTHSIDP